MSAKKERARWLPVREAASEVGIHWTSAYRAIRLGRAASRVGIGAKRGKRHYRRLLVNVVDLRACKEAATNAGPFLKWKETFDRKILDEMLTGKASVERMCRRAA